MNKHTPGPWHVSKSTMDRLIYADSEHAFDLAIVRDGGTADVDANARLIAAAPELLEAAQMMRAINQRSTRKECDAACDALDAAIAKATQA